MHQFHAGGFVGRDTLQAESFPGVLRIVGEIACQGGIVITVKKTLEVRDGDDEADPLVQTVDYAYNAHVRDGHTFLRYDNAHAHPGHADEHHRHDMDWRTGDELPGSPSWQGVRGWPTLGAFIEYVQTWYYENIGTLPPCDGYPQLGIGHIPDPDPQPTSDG